MKPRVAKLPVPLEREVQKGVVDLLHTMGCHVYNLAQGYRPGGKGHGTTRQTKGLADLYVIPREGLPFWCEIKRPGGVQSPEQVEFQRLNQAGGIVVVVGGSREVLAFLEARRKLSGLPWAGPLRGSIPKEW